MFQLKLLCRKCTDPLLKVWIVYDAFSHQVVATEPSREDAEAHLRTEYCVELERVIELFLGEGVDVNPSFLEQAFDDELAIGQAVESYFSDGDFDMSLLTPIEGEVGGFHVEIHNITRPYIAITEEAYNKLMLAKHDYYKLPSDVIVTFGNASTHGGDFEYALFPVKEEYAKKLLATQEA